MLIVALCHKHSLVSDHFIFYIKLVFGHSSCSIDGLTMTIRNKVPNLVFVKLRQPFFFYYLYSWFIYDGIINGFWFIMRYHGHVWFTSEISSVFDLINKTSYDFFMWMIIYQSPTLRKVLRSWCKIAIILFLENVFETHYSLWY